MAPSPTGNPVPSGCQWGLPHGQEVAWIGGTSWKTVNAGPLSPESAALEVVSSAEDLKTTATQTFITSPKLNVMAVRLRLDAPEPVGTLKWFQQFSPIPPDRAPLALPFPLPSASRGFASFFDAQRARLYQFRPAHPGRQDWDRARRLQQNHATPAEWSSFSDGAWCATAFSTRELNCAFLDNDNHAQEESSALAQSGAIVTATFPPTSPSVSMEVFFAFAVNRADADRALDTALQRGFDYLQAEAQADYAVLLSKTTPHIGGDSASRGAILRDLRALFAALDPNSGTIVAAPAQDPPLTATWPELGAWTALAWQLSGYPEQAGQQLDFYRTILAANESPANPSAVLPELLRADGSPALPSFVRNPASAAWIVLAATQLLRHSPANAAPELASHYYEALVVPTMQYLRRWSSPATGGPSPGFDPLLLRDTSSVSNELQYYLATEGAFEIAALAKAAPGPDWQAWQRQLDALLRFRIVNEPKGWLISPTLAAWAAMTLSPTNPLCRASVRTQSGVVALGECAIPSLPPDKPLTAGPDAFDSAIDLVAILHSPDAPPLAAP